MSGLRRARRNPGPPPLVSCLLVAQPDSRRFGYFKASVRAYCRQTYPNKELVIVTDGPTGALRNRCRDHLRALGRADVRWVHVPSKSTLGALRNRSVKEARGAVVCQWDDDDLSHPRRLELQLRSMRRLGADAILLKDVLHFFRKTREMYWLRWPQAHPGTLMCSRAAALACPYPAEGPGAVKGEDVAVLRRLRREWKVAVIREMPFLYVYTFHGGNTWGGGHHRNLTGWLGRTRDSMRSRKRGILSQVARFGLGRREILFMGKEGRAFAWTPAK